MLPQYAANLPPDRCLSRTLTRTGKDITVLVDAGRPRTTQSGLRPLRRAAAKIDTDVACSLAANIAPEGHSHVKLPVSGEHWIGRICKIESPNFVCVPCTWYDANLQSTQPMKQQNQSSGDAAKWEPSCLPKSICWHDTPLFCSDLYAVNMQPNHFCKSSGSSCVLRGQSMESH